MSTELFSRVFKRESLLEKIDEATNKKLETYMKDETQKTLPVYIFVEAICADKSRTFFDGANYMKRCHSCAERALPLTTTTVNGSAGAKKIVAVAFHYLFNNGPKSKILLQQHFKTGSGPEYPDTPISSFILGHLRTLKPLERSAVLYEVDSTLLKTLLTPEEEKTKMAELSETHTE